MADPVTPAPVSPTGTPTFIPPKAVPYVTLAWVIVCAVMGWLLIQYPSNTTVQLLAVVLGAIGPILGLASPGWRSAAKAIIVGMAVAAATMSLTGCALFTRTTTVLIPAEVKACGDQAIDVYQKVSAALELPTYEAKLLALAVEIPGGYALVKCAVQTYIAWNTPAPTVGIASAHALTMPNPDAPISRARAFLAAHP